jgi:hypothetical protein
VSGRLKAVWLLAWALLRTLVLRLLGRGRRGIAAFRANYDADRLPPVSPEERALLPSFGRCIACGLCDRGEGVRIVESGGNYRGIMSIMVCGSRSMPDYRAAAAALAWVSDDVLAEKERICPTRVPMRAVARFVRDKATEVGASLPPRVDAPRRASATEPDPVPNKPSSAARRL